MARQVSKRESLDSDRLAAIVEQVRQQRALKPAVVGLSKLTSSEQAQLQSALAKAGLEHTGKVLRVPVGDQLLDLVQRSDGAEGIANAQLVAAIKGSSKAEVARTLAELVDAGELSIVITSSGR